MKKSVLIIAIIFLANSVFAGNANTREDKNNTKIIYGKVIDKKSGVEIAGAEVRIADKICYTDFEGNFSAIISTKKTELTITSVSFNETKVNIAPSSYNTVVVELESK